jgi:hypothetical protein
VYRYAINHREELCGPYATVIDINPDQLPSVDSFDSLSGSDTAATIRHIQSDSRFNPHVRQLLHIAFKVAAAEGARYTNLLKEHRDIVAEQVTTNLYERHLRPLFAQ